MGRVSNIEWCDATWNCIRGCSRVSSGCKNCYAEHTAGRFSGKGLPYEGLAQIKHFRRENGQTERTESLWTGDIRYIPERLEDPIKWKEPRRIFVNSMSDLFHEKVKDEWISNIFSIMESQRQHTFQVLTKRPERMRDWVLKFDRWLKYARSVTFAEKLPNVWLGVSCEDQETADERIPLLLETPAAIRFISAEPLLSAINLPSLRIAWQCSGCRNYFAGPLKNICPICGKENYWSGSHQFNPKYGQVGSGLDWIIVGGESGPHARPMHLDWAQSIVNQCKAAGVAVFVKQLGTVPVMDEETWRNASGMRLLAAKNDKKAPAGTVPIWMNDAKGGDIACFPKELQVREFPKETANAS